MVLNARDDFDACMKEAEQSKGLRGYDTHRFRCITEYKDELKKQVPALNQIYEGYAKNFQAHDGALVSRSGASRADKALVKEIEAEQAEAMKSINNAK